MGPRDPLRRRGRRGAGRYLHDEGLLTWSFASIVYQVPLDGLFFQKLRPIVALFYAPVAPFGFTAFALVHVLVCSTAIPAIADVSRKLGLRAPNVPAFLVATSPLFLITAPGGHTNADAVCGLVWALWLCVRQRHVACGVLLGALVLARSEVAVFVLAIAIERLASERNPRVLLGAAIVPTLYVLAGMLYHQDLLWVLHYPPMLVAPVAHATFMDGGGAVRLLTELGDALLTLSPALFLGLLVRPTALTGTERGLAVGLVVFLVLIRALPLIGLFNFDRSPRYLLVGLPAVALLVGRQVDESFAGRDGGVFAVGALLVLGCVGWLTAGRGSEAVLLGAVAVTAIALVMIRLGKPGPALAVWALALVASLSLWPTRTRLLPRHEVLDEVERV